MRRKSHNFSCSGFASTSWRDSVPRLHGVSSAPTCPRKPFFRCSAATSHRAPSNSCSMLTGPMLSEVMLLKYSMLHNSEPRNAAWDKPQPLTTYPMNEPTTIPTCHVSSSGQQTERPSGLSNAHCLFQAMRPVALLIRPAYPSPVAFEPAALSRAHRSAFHFFHFTEHRGPGQVNADSSPVCQPHRENPGTFVERPEPSHSFWTKS